MRLNRGMASGFQLSPEVHSRGDVQYDILSHFRAILSGIIAIIHSINGSIICYIDKIIKRAKEFAKLVRPSINCYTIDHSLRSDPSHLLLEGEYSLSGNTFSNQS